MNPVKSLASATWAPLVERWNSLFPSTGKSPLGTGARVARDVAMEC
ncbi:hypothetical protein [Variovorax sp. HJSM1_2]